ncbi:Transmembrane protein [Entamoeba marina]
MNNSGVLNNNKEQQLLLTTISKKGFFLIFTIFSFLVITSIFFSLKAPSPWSSFTMSTWRCAGKDSKFNSNCNGVDLLDKTQKITLQLGPYSVFNQESRLEFYFEKIAKKEAVEGTIKLKYSLYGTNTLSLSNQKIDKDKLNFIETKTIDRKVKCKANAENCRTNSLTTEMYLEYPIYIVEVQVLGEQLKGLVGDMYFKITHVSKSYTTFELFWRLVFILFSCLATFVYLWFNRSVVQELWSHEQKWTIVLLTVLIWENNPLFPYEFLMDNAFYLFVNSVIDTVFICFLMFYVLIMFDALRKPIRQRSTFRFYFPRAILCCVLFALILLSFLYNKTRKIYSPTVTGSNDIFNVICSTSIVVVLGIYLFWLIFSIIRSFSEVRKLGSAGYRVRVYGLFTIIIVLLYVSLLSSAFYMGYRNNAVVGLATIAYVNWYCLILSVLYLPSAAVKKDLESRSTIVKLDEELIDIQVEDYDEDDKDGQDIVKLDD